MANLMNVLSGCWQNSVPTFLGSGKVIAMRDALEECSIRSSRNRKCLHVFVNCLLNSVSVIKMSETETIFIDNKLLNEHKLLKI